MIRPHFHVQDQFQVVAEGGGTLGRHAVAPIHVHYASRHTGYGPITAGNQGLSYFTFRAVTTPYAYFLPESRDQMQSLPKRNLLGHAFALVRRADACAPGAKSRSRRSSSHNRTASRLGYYDCLPSATFVPPSMRRRADRFYLVCEGVMVARSERLPRFATAFVSADERDFEVVAGEEGLEVLVAAVPGAGQAMLSAKPIAGCARRRGLRRRPVGAAGRRRRRRNPPGASRSSRRVLP